MAVECCDPDTGEMQLSVVREGVPADEADEEMAVRPAELDLLHELIGRHKQTGQSLMQSLQLNVPD